MQIELKIVADTNDMELAKILACIMSAQPVVACNPGTTSPVAPSEALPLQDDGGVSVGEDKAIENVADASPTLSDKPKRTRKPKEEPAPAIEEPEEIPEEAYSEPNPVVEAPTFTLDDVRAALQAFTQQKSIEEGLALLRSFKAGRISELAEEDYAAFIEAAKV